MRVFCRCDGCKKEGEPNWVSGGFAAAQWGSQAATGHYGPPLGWGDLGSFLLCADCTVRVKDRLAEIVKGAA